MSSFSKNMSSASKNTSKFNYDSSVTKQIVILLIAVSTEKLIVVSIEQG